jgi:hypothetical protein
VTWAVSGLSLHRQMLEDPGEKLNMLYPSHFFSFSAAYFGYISLLSLSVIRIGELMQYTHESVL